MGSKPTPGLYLVATPIGNLDDITIRALKLLRAADLVACEDSRVTGRLFTLLGLKVPELLPYHDHNAEKAGARIVERLKAGAVVALVSDAGMPSISDPGFRLVQDCLAAGLPVTSLPGPSAPLVALQLSGLPSDRFFFAGFLPSRQGARRAALAALTGIPSSLIFLESPRRLAQSLADMAEILGPRQAAMARELTKLYEEVRRASLPELAEAFRTGGPPKGEIVLVVAPPLPAAAPDEEAIEGRLAILLERLSVKEAAAALAGETGLKRRDLYARALKLGGRDEG